MQGPGRSHLRRRACRAADAVEPVRRLRPRRPAAPAGGVASPAVRVPRLPGPAERPAAAATGDAALPAERLRPRQLRRGVAARQRRVPGLRPRTSCAVVARCSAATSTTAPRCRGRRAAGTTARTWAACWRSCGTAGEIAISRREGTQRVWDLWERVLPEADGLPDPVVAVELLDRQLRARGFDRTGWGGALEAGELPVRHEARNPCEPMAWRFRSRSTAARRVAGPRRRAGRAGCRRLAAAHDVARPVRSAGGGP